MDLVVVYNNYQKEYMYNLNMIRTINKTSSYDGKELYRVLFHKSKNEDFMTIPKTTLEILPKNFVHINEEIDGKIELSNNLPSWYFKEMWVNLSLLTHIEPCPNTWAFRDPCENAKYVMAYKIFLDDYYFTTSVPLEKILPKEESEYILTQKMMEKLIG